MQEVAAQTSLLGAEHPDTLTVRANLAGTMRELGELDRARAILDEVVEAFTRVLGARHPKALATGFALAAVMHEQGDVREANALLAKLLAVSTEAFGKRYTTTSQAAWQIVQYCAQHEGNKRTATIVANLS